MLRSTRRSGSRDLMEVGMEIGEAQERARQLRSRFSGYEARHGTEWTTADLVSGLVTDIGDLARLVQEHEGRRVGRDDLAEALEHEVGDCLWSLLVIADRCGVDADVAYAGMLAKVGQWLAERGA